MIDDGNEACSTSWPATPAQLIVEEVDEKSARRLVQLVRGGEPEVRLLAVRALGRTGDLDYVPTLLYALTDPDKRSSSKPATACASSAATSMATARPTTSPTSSASKPSPPGKTGTAPSVPPPCSNSRYSK